MSGRSRSGRTWLGALVLMSGAAGLAGAAPGCLQLGDQHDRMNVHQGECFTCHQRDFELTTMPGHLGLFPVTCADCHNTHAWVPAEVQHDAWWPLRNLHVGPECAQCHTDPGTGAPRYTGTPTDCVSCHQADYDAAAAPPHAGYPTACADCHTDAGWRPSTFMHPWPLDGAHLTISCFACHTGSPPTYAGTPRECAACHMTDYTDASSPPHAGFATTCADCHSTAAWRPSTWEHPWSLEGAHIAVACAGRCHTDPSTGAPRYAGTPRACVGCHQADYDRAGSLHADHGSNPTTCSDCHSMSNWDAVGGSHPEAQFPIATGHHAGIACGDCHDPALGGPSGGMNTNCLRCHTASMMSGHPREDGYTYLASQPHFCLNCHPRGLR